MASDNLLVSLKEEVKMILSTHEVSNHFVKFIVHLRAFSRGSQTGRTTTKILWTIEYSCLIAFKCQFSSVAQLCPTLCDPMDGSTPGFPVHHQLPLLKLMSIESVMPSNHLNLCCPLLLLLSIFPSIRDFPNSSSHQVAKVLELQHQSFQWIFRTDFL